MSGLFLFLNMAICIALLRAFVLFINFQIDRIGARILTLDLSIDVQMLSQPTVLLWLKLAMILVISRIDV